MAAYQTALNEAQRELAKLEKEKVEISRRILHLEQTVATLRRLTSGANPQAFVNAGITDAIREALQTAPVPLTVSILRNGMERLGYDFSGYENPSASIAGTLERLVKAGEVAKVRVGKGDTTVAGYVWTKKTKLSAKNRALVAMAEDIKTRRKIKDDRLYKAAELIEEAAARQAAKQAKK
jgi:hypothetical protein